MWACDSSLKLLYAGLWFLSSTLQRGLVMLSLLILRGSPDIAFSFRAYEFKKLLSVRPHKVLNLFISWFFRYLNIHFKTASMKALTNYGDAHWNPIQRAFSGFQYAGYECENHFSKLLMRLKVYSLSCPAIWNPPVALCSGFKKPDSQNTSGFLKPACLLTVTARSVNWNTDSRTAFGKLSAISKCFHRSCLNINFWTSPELLSKRMLKP